MERRGRLRHLCCLGCDRLNRYCLEEQKETFFIQILDLIKSAWCFKRDTNCIQKKKQLILTGCRLSSVPPLSPVT